MATDDWCSFLRPESHALSLDLGHVAVAPEALEALAQNRRLENLRLHHNGLDASAARALAMGISKNQSISTLKINYNARMGVEGVEAIMKAVATNTRLRSFHFGDNELDTEGLLILTTSIANHPQILHLDLGWANVTCSSCEALAALLRRNHILEELILTENDLGEGGIVIAKAVAESSLKRLECNYNSLQDEGAKAIAEMLRENRRLEILGLHANDFTAVGVEALCHSVKANRSLSSLDLRHNKCGDVGPVLGEAMAEGSVTSWDLRSMDLGPRTFAALRTGSAKQLNLADNQPGDGFKGFTEQLASPCLEELEVYRLEGELPTAWQLDLARCLQKNPCLRVLDMGGQYHSAEVCQLLMQAIIEGSQLESLKALDIDEDLDLLVKALSRSSLKLLLCRLSHGLGRFLETASSWSSLKVLDLDGSKLGGKGQVIAQFLRSEGQLEELKLTRCSLNEEDANELSAGLARNTWLRGLWLSHNSLNMGPEALSKALELCRLEGLCMVEVGLENASFQGLANSLKRNKTLKLWEFSGEVDDVTGLAELLQVNTTLQEIHSDGDRVNGQGAEMLVKALEINSSVSSFRLLHLKPKTLKKDVSYSNACKVISWLQERNSHPPLVLNSTVEPRGEEGEEVLVTLKSLSGDTVLELRAGNEVRPRDLVRRVFDELGYLRPLRLLMPDGRTWQEASSLCAESAGYPA